MVQLDAGACGGYRYFTVNRTEELRAVNFLTVSFFSFLVSFLSFSDFKKKILRKKKTENFDEKNFREKNLRKKI